jgi:hypothetical protein
VELEKKKFHGEESMFHRKRVTVTVTFVFLAMLMCAPAAFGQAVVTDMQLTNQTILNECNGEMVDLSGTLHEETSFSTNTKGATHFSLNATTHLTGIGEITGVNYVANDTTHIETNTRGVAQEQSMNTKMKLISQGPQTPNMVDHATLHVVIDKDNNVKVDISKHQIKCN